MDTSWLKIIYRNTYILDNQILSGENTYEVLADSVPDCSIHASHDRLGQYSLWIVIFDLSRRNESSF